MKYNIAEEKYYIKDLGRGFGAFMKVINYIHLKSDSLINIGDSYIVVSIGDEDANENESTNKNNTFKSVKSVSPKKNITSETSNEFNRCITDNNYSLHLKIYSGQLKIEPT